MKRKYNKFEQLLKHFIISIVHKYMKNYKDPVDSVDVYYVIYKISFFKL